MTDERWAQLWELMHAEDAAYARLMAERNPRVGNVYPTRVRAAYDEWLETLAARDAVAQPLADELGVRPPSVLGRVLRKEWDEPEAD